MPHSCCESFLLTLPSFKNTKIFLVFVLILLLVCNEDNALISYLTLFVELYCLSIFYCVLPMSFIASLLCYAYWQASLLVCWEFYHLLVVWLWWVSSSPYCELCHLLVVSFIIFLICILGEFCHLWIFLLCVHKAFQHLFFKYLSCPF